MDTRKSTRKTTNRICAIDDAVPATPLNPRAAATSATIRNVSAHPSMAFSFHDLTMLHERNAVSHIWFQNGGANLKSQSQCMPTYKGMLRSFTCETPFLDMGNVRNLGWSNPETRALAPCYATHALGLLLHASVNAWRLNIYRASGRTYSRAMPKPEVRSVRIPNGSAQTAHHT